MGWRKPQRDSPPTDIDALEAIRAYTGGYKTRPYEDDRRTPRHLSPSEIAVPLLRLLAIGGKTVKCRRGSL